MTSDFSPTPDPTFDRFARIVRDALAAPTALLSLVLPDRQVFPGAAGLPDPLSTVRETPIDQSICRFVVGDDAPLVVSDLRSDPRLADHPAVIDLGIVAYAGFPLRDPTGTAIGSLCAMDSRPRSWTDTELRILAELAEACSSEIALHQARAALDRAASLAIATSRQAVVLLTLSEALGDTETTTDIAVVIQSIACPHLGCLHAGIWLAAPDARTLAYVDHPSLDWPQARAGARLDASEVNPIGAALLRRDGLFYRDRAEQDAAFPGSSNRIEPIVGGGRALLPLLLGDQRIGALVLLWERVREFSDIDRETITALASYTSQAVHRAQLLAERRSAASTLQAALLPSLPQSPHAELIARYRTAVADDEIGGDWYDAIVLGSGATNVVIGDVAGHDLAAAATMGGLRNMLRAIMWAIDEPPAGTLSRLDRAVRDIQPDALATMLIARIAPHESQPDRYQLDWSNAGHPLPVLLTVDGRVELLVDSAAADLMVGVAADVPRHGNHLVVDAGSTLLLYTDGLIETRTDDLAKGSRMLLEAVERHRALEPGAMIDAILEELVGDAPADDVAVLAVRFTPTT